MLLRHTPRLIFLAALSILLFSTTNRAVEPSDRIEMGEMSVTDSRLQAATLENAYTIHAIEQQTLSQKVPRSLPEALNHLPGVLIQKTANGHGSPFIRGFTGYRTLALIDGVRYNNSVYRDGPNEYFSLIDVNTLSSLDLYSGPASAIFGSDAIGGTLSLNTQSSQFLNETDNTGFWHGTHHLRYANAENSTTQQHQIDIGTGQRWGLLAGVSLKHFGNVDAADLGELEQTGYREQGVNLKLDWLLNDTWDLTMLHQRLRQDDVWRTHSTIYAKSFAGTEVGSDLKRIKDQQRQLSYLTLRGYQLNAVIEQLRLTLSHQRWREQGDRVRKSGNRILEFFESNMTGVDLQLESAFDTLTLVYGFDYYLDRVDSGRRDFLANGSLNRIRIQGPIGDDASYDIFGSYLSAKFALTPQFELGFSSRYSRVGAQIGRYQDPNTGRAARFSDNWNNISSAIRLSYDLFADQSQILWAGFSESFRAPNIADLSRFGGSRSNETEIAATNLSPEQFLTLELGYQYQRDRWAFSATYYYTDIDDYITSSPTGKIVAGQVEVSKQNSAEGFIHGVELDSRYNVNPNLTINGDITWLEGRLTRDDFIDSFRQVTEPFSRIMPLTAHLGFRWTDTSQQWWLGNDITLAAKANKLSAGDKGDLQRIPPSGTPSYRLVNLYGGWQLSPNWLLTAQINNLFDKAYRSHGSGSNEPGRNLIFSIRRDY